jgi:carbonic anhydrase
MSQTPISASEALHRLRTGNERFVDNVRSIEAIASQGRRAGLAAGQTPFAVILSCSDSRVPAEIVFDCGLGDLFVVRVAGNVVAPSLLGSIEFAVSTFGTELVLVMGHSQCGAVKATLSALGSAGRPTSPNILDIVSRIAPSVGEMVAAQPNHPDLLEHAVRANVRASVAQLCHGSRILEDLIAQGKLTVIGAEYSLESGRVHFLKDPLSLPLESPASSSVITHRPPVDRAVS